MIRVGVIGFGAIGRTIVECWDADLAQNAELTALCVRAHQIEEARAAVGPCTAVVTSVDALLETAPDLIVEAAGHAAVQTDATRLLLAGCDLYLLSVGVLADDRLRAELTAAARLGKGRLSIPPGALAGFDGLLSYRQQGLQSVHYRSTKPPLAWKETPAEARFDLAALDRATVLFEGSAREAARLYPKNANLAAAVALAGIGFDATTVALVADPDIQTNSGLITAIGVAGEMRIEVIGAAADRNPKTSALVGMSVLASLKNQVAEIAFV